jgi:hypothetical protein
MGKEGRGAPRVVTADQSDLSGGGGSLATGGGHTPQRRAVRALQNRGVRESGRARWGVLSGGATPVADLLYIFNISNPLLPLNPPPCSCRL